MPKPFDAVSKTLIDTSPLAWARFLEADAVAAEVVTATGVDADASVVTAASDKVLLVTTPAGRHLQAIDFQSGPDASTPRRACLYAVILHDRHELHVKSFIVLLRRQANLTAINGVYELTLPEPPTPEAPAQAEQVPAGGQSARPARRPYLRFEYTVIRVWEQPAAAFLNAGLGLVPLALLTDEAATDMTAAVDRVQERFDADPEDVASNDFWAATSVLMGLRYSPALTHQLLRRIMKMEDSSVVMDWIERGDARGSLRTSREFLLEVGEEAFGAPTPEHRRIVESLSDVNRLKRLAKRIPHVGSWAELLADAD